MRTSGKIKAMQSANVGIVGTGPAGLMAAILLASKGVRVTLFEKRKSPGRKLLVAGSSGLNITYDASLDEFARFYRLDGGRMREALDAYSPKDWREFIESTLGLETFVGTSKRLFVREMKAATLLKRWMSALDALGVTLKTEQELTDFSLEGGGVRLEFNSSAIEVFDAAVFALGGASWEPQGTPLGWPRIFDRKKIAMIPFAPSNVGYEAHWPLALGRELEGKPIKSIVLSTNLGAKSGDLMIKAWGIEGTPVYHVGCEGTAYIDFKPGLSENEALRQMRAVKENLSPFRRLKHKLKLGDAALTLIKNLTPEPELKNLETLTCRIKRFPIELERPRPLEEAISSMGGVSWDELDATLMLKRFPGLFVAGEMIAWDAPTGGFLIQGCVSQGALAARGLMRIASMLSV